MNDIATSGGAFMSANEQILYSVEDAVASITLNRPERLNALTRELMLRLGEALRDADVREDVRVISLQGAGKAFCAGQDLAERDPRKQDRPFDLEAIQKELFHPVVRAIYATPKPVVACVSGVAAGAGASLALAADIVIAGTGVKFLLSFSNVGLSVDAGGGLALTRSLGVARTKALLMLGEGLSAEEAEAAGLIWKAIPDVELTGAHQALLKQLAEAPAAALAGVKQAVAAAVLAPDLESYLLEEARLQGVAGRHPDYAEGVLAFLERRKPVFGRE